MRGGWARLQGCHGDEGCNGRGPGPGVIAGVSPASSEAARTSCCCCCCSSCSGWSAGCQPGMASMPGASLPPPPAASGTKAAGCCGCACCCNGSCTCCGCCQETRPVISAGCASAGCSRGLEEWPASAGTCVSGKASGAGGKVGVGRGARVHPRPLWVPDPLPTPRTAGLRRRWLAGRLCTPLTCCGSMRACIASARP